ncbi:hypothetical protein SUGI_0791500 [Cryptomeria japonica]|nr:hypothetical protein SUGI_0791500 [Cryptomeria japonica]
MDKSNAICGKRLASIGLENTKVECQTYHQLLVSTPSLGQYILGGILFMLNQFEEQAKDLSGRHEVSGRHEEERRGKHGITEGYFHAAKLLSPHPPPQCTRIGATEDWLRMAKRKRAHSKSGLAACLKQLIDFQRHRFADKRGKVT